MDMQTRNRAPKNFLEAYETEIAPKLKSIDILLKTFEQEISTETAANVLDLDLVELKALMDEMNIRTINKHNFFLIMKKGKSKICQMFKRELSCGSPYFYSKKDISYIYDLDPKQISSACDFLELEEITAYTLPILFAQIPVTV